jgi:hypothetical protein
MGFNLELLLGVLVVAVGFLLLRILFSPTDSKSPLSFDQIHAENQHSTLQSTAVKTAWDKSRTAPVSDNLGRVRVTQLNFAHFDAVPGPPDPDSFADELILELYDSVSDFRWTATYVIATPAGIRKLMDEEKWSFFYATEIFVVRRYDLQTIREAVYGRLKEVHDEVPLDPEEPPLRA